MQPVAAEGAIREQLSKVLASGEFQNSDRMCRFLRFVVDAKLRGEEEQVKEYLIGKEVFDRDSEYDPRLDPIVRVEARRLRKKLDAYYLGAGAEDSIRFELPKGAYVPEIRESTAERVVEVLAPPEAHRAWIKFAVLALLVCAAVVAGVSFWKRPTSIAHSVVAVVPARWMWNGNDFPDVAHDEDISERVAANLAARQSELGGARIVAWPSIRQARGMASRQMTKEFGLTLLLVVAVRIEADGFRMTGYLMDPLHDQKLTVIDKRSVALNDPASREKAAALLASTLVQALQEQQKRVR